MKFLKQNNIYLGYKGTQMVKILIDAGKLGSLVGTIIALAIILSGVMFKKKKK